MPDHRPMPNHQLDAFRRDPHDCSASEVQQLVDEIDRLTVFQDELAEDHDTLAHENDRLRERIGDLEQDVEGYQRRPCPHTQTGDDGTSHCGLAESELDQLRAENQQMHIDALAAIRQAEVQRDTEHRALAHLAETVRDVAESLGETGSPADTLAATTLNTACDKAGGQD